MDHWTAGAASEATGPAAGGEESSTGATGAGRKGAKRRVGTISAGGVGFKKGILLMVELG